MSELELSLFRQRSQEALRQMARRGDLVLGVAAGYVKCRVRPDRKESGQSACNRPFNSSSRNSPSSRVRGKVHALRSGTKGSNCPPNRAPG